MNIFGPMHNYTLFRFHFPNRKYTMKAAPDATMPATIAQRNPYISRLALWDREYARDIIMPQVVIKLIISVGTASPEVRIMLSAVHRKAKTALPMNKMRM